MSKHPHNCDCDHDCTTAQIQIWNKHLLETTDKTNTHDYVDVWKTL